MFEKQIFRALSDQNEITIHTFFGWNRGRVIKCYDSWFVFQRNTDNTKINVYFEDVVMLEEHPIVKEAV